MHRWESGGVGAFCRVSCADIMRFKMQQSGLSEMLHPLARALSELRVKRRLFWQELCVLKRRPRELMQMFVSEHAQFFLPQPQFGRRWGSETGLIRFVELQLM